MLPLPELLRSLRSILLQPLSRRRFFRLGAASVASLIITTPGLRRCYADDATAHTPGIALPGQPATTIISPVQHGDFVSRFPKSITNDQGSKLTLDDTRLLLAFSRELLISHVEKLLLQANPDLALESLEKDSASTQQGPRINDLPHQFWTHSRNGKPIPSALVSSIATVFAPHLKWVGPAFRAQNTTGQTGVVCALPNALVIMPVKSTNTAFLDSELRKHNLVLAPEITKYLGGYRYYFIPTNALTDPAQRTVYEMQQILLNDVAFNRLVAEASFDYLPLVSPSHAAFSPSDPLYTDQWNLNKINEEAGWNSAVVPVLGQGVVIAIIDGDGVQYDHPDFQGSEMAFVTNLTGQVLGATFRPGLGTEPEIVVDILPNSGGKGTISDFPHGTKCAGIIAARYNSVGIAGLAGRCKLLSIKIPGYQNVCVAAAINYASGEGTSPPVAVNVISMSFGNEPEESDYFNTSLINAALNNASVNHNIILCASAGNSGKSPPQHPAAHPFVIACGASNQSDDRCRQTDWGSVYGGNLSVIAPGIEIRTTDLTDIAGSTKTSSPDGDYERLFARTSSAAPHVAGLAALLLSKYPTLKTDSMRVRAIIEQAADKVGRRTVDSSGNPITPSAPLDYTYTSDKKNGDWNQETGYGRINVYHALDFADVRIPVTISSGITRYDIVVSPSDDVSLKNFEEKKNLSNSTTITRGQSHYVFVRIYNDGPASARDVSVHCCLVKQQATPFAYPTDWTLEDSAHLTLVTSDGQSSLSQIQDKAYGLVKFALPIEYTQACQGWVVSGTSPYLLASAISANDYSFNATKDWTTTNILSRKNNLAQASLQVGKGNPPPAAPTNLSVQ